MNKSKFLKKSLAMVLAVMMIVAMIPLGASALTVGNDKVSTLQAVRINGSLVDVEADGTTFKADVPVDGVSTVTLAVDLSYQGETAAVMKNNGDPLPLTSTPPAATLDLPNNFDKEGSAYVVPLTLTSQDTKHTANYTIYLTPVTKNTVAEIDTVKAGDKVLSASIEGSTINVAVPMGYTSGAEIVVTAKDAGTVNDSTTTETVTVTHGGTIKLTSESGGTTRTYTMAVTETPILTGLKIGGVDATIDHDEDNTTPSHGSASISATYPGSVLVIPDTEDKAPAQKFAIAYTVAVGAKVSYSTNGGTNYTEITSGKEYDLTNRADDDNRAFLASTAAKIKVSCKGVDMVYALALGTEQATDNTIYAATVDGEATTIAGQKITANVQNAIADPVTVTITTSEKARLAASAGTFAAGTPADGKKVWTSTDSTVANLKAGITIVVTSENGVDRQYSLKITSTGDVDNTVLTSLTLGDYEGVVNEANHTVTVTVPYLTTDADLKTMPVIATTNAYVAARTDSTIAGSSPVATGADVFGSSPAFAMSKKGETGSVSGVIWAVAKNDSAPATKYTVTAKLETAKTGNTLSSINATSANAYRNVTSDNTYRGLIKDNTLTFSVAHSKWTDDLYLKDIATANGGVPFMIDGTTVSEMPAPLDSKKIKKIGTAITGLEDPSTVNANTDLYLHVLPEIEARKQLNSATPTNVVANLSKGTKYAVKTAQLPASTDNTLVSVKVGDTALSTKFAGTVPYGVTAGDTTTPAEIAKSTFIEFTTRSQFAKVYVTDATGAATHKTSGLIELASGGDETDDGVADAVSATNGKLLLVRDATDNTADIYVTKDGTTFKPVDRFVVEAENGDYNWDSYIFGTLHYAAPNTEAKITSFKLANATGKIKAEGNDNWTISVTVPFGTKVTALVPTFTTSSGATVIDQTSASPVKSGETILDFTYDRVFSVTSEEGGKTVTYTIKVTVSDEFSDVPANAWYHDFVMQAAAQGIVSGYPDGTFKPTNSIKRKDFAVMVVNMLGVDTSTFTTTKFKDVPNTDYAMDEIAYCVENDIITGYEDGTFRPEKTITRQEAAVIMARALKLSATTPDQFKDDAKIASWAKTAVYQCRAAGVFSGDNGNFKPTTNITRAEAATVMVQASK